MADNNSSKKSGKTTPEVRIGNYIIGETLGVGTFGKVKVGVHKSTGLQVAVKIVNRDKIKSLDVAGKLRREIQNLWLFRHPNIIKLYQVISTPTDIFMIMEYVSGGELFDFIVNSGKLTEKDARKFFQQIVSGVDYCHRHKVVHRDLKPENLLLDLNQNVKIADFGLSNIMQDGEFLRTSCGSPNYAAPEVISGKLYAGPEVDVWSCGVILYALLCGTLPFDDEHIPNLFKKIKAGFFHMPDYLSTEVKDLLRGMLQVDPIRRMTIEDIKSHPWFVIELPSCLFPHERDEDASIIDKDAVQELCRACGVTEREVFAALISNDPTDQLCVGYHLIIDNKRFGSESNPDEVNNFYVASTADSITHAGYALSTRGPISPARPHPERMPEGPAMTRTLDVIENAGMPTSKKFKWHLGIRSQSRPWDIMHEVFKAMKSLGYEWKIVNDFNIRCRKWNTVKQHHSKMVLQLYQVDTRSYLLDFKCIDENPHPESDPMNSRRRSSCLPVAENNQLQTGTSPCGGTQNSSEHLELHESACAEKHQTMEFFEMCTELITALAR